MKKSLSLLLAIVLVLSSLACLTVVGSAATENALPNQEIAFYNISLKTNTRILFAVPHSDEFTTKNLQLLVWEGNSASGLYNKKDAVSKGEILEPSGKMTIGEGNAAKDYIIFSYAGLSASEMTTTVYARTLYTNARGDRSYSEVYDYSVTEFAMSYDGELSDLLAKMLAYGDACEAHFSASAAQSYKASDAKSLVPITVTTKIGNTVLSTQKTQLAKVGETITLKAPHVDGATLSSWSVTDADASATGVQYVVKASGNELTATYANNKIMLYNHESSKLGAYASSSLASQSDEVLSDGTGANANNMENDYNSTAFYNGAATFAPVKGLAKYAKFEVVGDESNKYIKYSHSEAGQVNGAGLSGKGIGDSVSTLSLTIKIKAPENEGAKMPTTSFRIGRAGPGNTSSDRGPDVAIFTVSDDSITLTGAAADGYTKVIVADTPSDKFVTVTVVIDFSANRMYGYADGVLTAVSELPELLVPSSYVGGADNGNTAFTSNFYGGYDGSDLKSIEGCYDATNDVYNTAAVEEYLENNRYLYFDDIGIYAGNIMQ